MPDTTATVGTPTAPAATQTSALTIDDASVTTDTAASLELSHTFMGFDDKEHTCTYHFRRPLRPKLARAVEGVRKNAMHALDVLCLDSVIASEKAALKVDLDTYDGLGSTFGNEILSRCGFGELGK